MVAILVKKDFLLKQGLFLEITSITVCDEQPVFFYNQNREALKLMANKESMLEGTSPVNYSNRWNRCLKATTEEYEISVEIPRACLVEKQELTSEEQDASTMKQFNKIVLRIEYTCQGSFEGLRFVKKISEDGTRLEVSDNYLSRD